MRRPRLRTIVRAALLLIVSLFPAQVAAQETFGDIANEQSQNAGAQPGTRVTLTPGASSWAFPSALPDISKPQNFSAALQIVILLTVLSLAPAILIMMTSFTRIVIVLSFVRSALALQGTPANQILIGLSLFMTYFIMEPIWAKIDSTAIQPYMAKQITSQQAMVEGVKPLRTFMLSQTRPKDVELFASINRQASARRGQLGKP